MLKLRCVGLACLACLLLFAAWAGAANNATFTDPMGDVDGGSPDIAAVQVSNDDAGRVVFGISIPNRPALGDSDLVAVLVDADGKSSTGCARGTFGAEYALDVLARRYVFGRCVHGRWDFTKPPASFDGSYRDATLTLAVNRRDLGGTSNVKFRVGAAGTSAAGVDYDFAPNTGVDGWAYRIVAPPQAVKKPPNRHPRRLRKVLRIRRS